MENIKESIIETTFVEEDAKNILEKNSPVAKDILNNDDKMERFIQRMENKMRVIPKVGDKLASVPALFSLVKSYYKKEYTDLPIGTIIAIIAALLYFLTPVDAIPDVLPGIGHLDDALVIAVCLKLVDSDVQEYLEWRKMNGKNLF